MSGRKPKGHAKKSGGQAEDQLSLLGRPEVLYKNLADTSPDAIFIGNTESVVVYASPSCLDIFGYTPEKFLSDPQIAMKIIHPDCRPQLIEFWENYAKTKIFPKEPSEWAWIRKDNKVVYTENTFRTLYNETGGVIGFQTIARDITERKQAAESLRKSEEEFRTLFENVNDAIVYVDTHGKIVSANKRTKEIFGYTPDELEGKNFAKLGVISPKSLPGILKLFKDTIRSGKVQNPVELELIGKKGNKVSVEANTSFIKKDGKVVGIVSLVRDITERKQATDSLKKREEEIQVLFEGIDEIVYKVAVNNDDLYQSQLEFIGGQIDGIMGYSGEDFIKDPSLWFRIIHPDDMPSVQKSTKKIIDSKSLGQREYRLRRKDSEEYVWLEDKITPITDEKGKVVAFFGAARDITERKKTEDALRESEEKFRILAEKSPNMIFINKKGSIIYANEKCEEIMGYKREELYSPDFNFLSLIAPESIDTVKANYGKHMKGEDVPPYEYSILSKAGKKIDGIHTTRLIKYEGETAILGIITDITERKQMEEKLRESEEQYRRIFENSPVGIMHYDKNGVVTNCNEYLARSLGAPREKIIGFDMLSSMKNKDVKAAIKATLSGKPVHYEGEYFSITGGKLMIAKADFSPITSEDGSPIGGVTIVEDITQRKQADEELEKHRYHLEDLVKERTTDLTKTNEQLQREITERETAEKALRESEKRFRMLTEGSLVGVYIVQDDKFRYVNPSLAKTFGYLPDELMDKLGPLDLIRSDDRSLVAEQLQRRLDGELESSHFTFRGLRIDGGAVHCEVLGRRIDYQGHPAIIGTMMDISERKIAELEMRRRLMKFRLEDGKLYMVEEPELTLSLEAFKELLGVGYRGFSISRTPEAEFKKHVKDEIGFLWLAEKGGKKALPPKVGEIEVRIEKLSGRMAILIDRLDYLIFKNGFKKTLSFVQSLREHASLTELIIILSIDPSTLSKRELRLLEKETSEIEPMHREIPKDLHEVLRFVYNRNLVGVKPTYTDVRLKMGVSKPTVRKKIRQLSSIGYILETKKGMYKVVELTDKGKSLFSR
ncbi:MAG: PAS domain S-box protein [Candidatus Hydrothermarchaeales archaeon]